MSPFNFALNLGNQPGGLMQRFNDMRQNNPEALLALASGLMQGDLGAGMMNASQFMGKYRERMAEQQQKNKTAEYLSSQFGMSPEEAAAVVGDPNLLRHVLQQRSRANKDTRYSLTPVYGTDDQGNPVLGTLGDDGSFKRIDTGGFNISTGVDRVDLGTGWGLLDKRSGNLVGTLPKENYQESYDKSAGAEAGKAHSERLAELPKVEQQAANMLSTLDLLENHPGLSSAVGWQGNIPDSMIPGGTAAAGFLSVLNQVQGQAFLQAFESLKGGGQITEIEGRKATEAITRLNRNLSETEFKKAIGELREVINIGLDRARRGITVNGSDGVSSSTVRPAPAAPATQRRRFNPATGRIE